MLATLLPHYPSKTIRVFIAVSLVIGVVALWAISARVESSPTTRQRAEQGKSRSASVSEKQSATQKAAADGSYGKLPLSFEANCGQSERDVKFLSHGPGYSVSLTAASMVLATRGASSSRSQNSKQVNQPDALPSPTALTLTLKGARSDVSPIGTDQLGGKINYFLGNDPAHWIANVPTFAKVRYEGIYAGIDLVYYGNRQQLEYDFEVAPHTNVNTIRWTVAGAKKITLDAKGNLILQTRGGKLSFQKPISYQDVAGQRHFISTSYSLEPNHELGFKVGKYDPSLPLVIDPVLVYSTYLGGSSLDSGASIAVDSTGSAYITGQTFSTNFPISNALQAAKGASADAYITKLNPTGSAIMYSTYLGGNGSDISFGIAVDAAGNAYVTGQTGSTDFPLANALQSSLAGVFDGFALKLNSTGSALIYSTYLGGGLSESANGVAVDAGGNAYIVGSTSSRDFPVTNPVQANRSGSAIFRSTNAAGNWVASEAGLNASSVQSFTFDPANSANVFAATASGIFKSTNGGSNWNALGAQQIDNVVNKIAVDPSNSSIIYAATTFGVFKSVDGGLTFSTINNGLGGSSIFMRDLIIDPTFPLTLYAAAANTNAVFKSTDGGSSWTSHAINGSNFSRVLALDPTSTAVVYSGTDHGVFRSTNGGTTWAPANSGIDQQVSSLIIDPTNTATLYAGLTNSGVFKSTNAGSSWTFISNSVGFISTPSLALDRNNPLTIYVGSPNAPGIFKSTDGGTNWSQASTGYSSSTINTLAVDPVNGANVIAGTQSGSDVFLTKLSPSGAVKIYSTYLGGQGNDTGSAVALDSNDNAYVTGSTSSTNFPLANALQSTASIPDAFVTKFNAAGSALIYSTFLGGSFIDSGRGIAVDSAGNAFVAGTTSSIDFPTVNPLQSANNGFFTSDAFVSKINPSGSALVFSTYLGGVDNELGNSIALDAGGNAYITGSTSSNDFPVRGAFQPARGALTMDAFVSKISANGASLVYSSYLGGVGADSANDIAVDGAGNSYLVGTTSSADYPTASALQPLYAGANDAFVAKIGLSPDLVLTVNDSPEPVTYGSNLTYTLTITNDGELPAHNVRINDTLLSGTGVISLSSPSGTCSGNRFITCDLGTIDPGASATATFVVVPPAIVTMVNTATVSSTDPEATLSNNSVTTNTHVEFTDLVLKNTSALLVTEIGGVNTYIVTVTNKGQSAASAVTVTNNLPAETTFVSCTSTGGGVCGGSGNNRTVAIPTLSGGASFTATFAARVNNGVAPGTVINDTASVSSAMPDINPNNDAQTATTVTRTASGPKLNGLLAYTSRDNSIYSGADDIYVSNADGSGQKDLTFETGSQDFSPAWSPDGTKIAYEASLTGIFVMNADGSNKTQITTGNYDSAPTWSPDGTRIAFVNNSGPDPSGVYVMNSDGTNSRRLGTGGGSPTWSPDGSRIAINTGVLSVMYADGSAVRNLPLAQQPGPTFGWSPDSSKLVFGMADNSTSGRSIYIINVDGTGLTRIDNTSGGFGACWSPDGTKVAFNIGTLTSGAEPGVYTINLDGSGLTKVSGTLPDGFYPAWQIQPPNFTPLPPTYTITGRVSNSANGDAASGSIQVTGSLTRTVDINFTTGNFVFRGLVSGGNYTITPVIFGNPASNPTSRVYNNLSANQTGADFAITYAPRQEITGTIRDHNGNPLSAVHVTMGNSIPNGASAFTNINGGFVFPTSVFPGFNPFLQVIPDGSYSNYYFEPTIKFFTSPSGNDFVGRPRTASISGKVTVGGVGKAGIPVFVDSQFLSTVTDADGNYMVTGVAEGITAGVQADTTTYPFSPKQTVTVNGQLTGINFTAPANQFLIRGEVISVGSSQRVADATVTLSGGANATMQTDSQGRYSFGPVPANVSYTIAVSKTGYNFQPPSATITNLTANAQLNFTAYLNTLEFYYTSTKVSAIEADGRVTLTVVRSGLLSETVKVDYVTSDGTARQRTDYTTRAGTLTFGPQEQAKTITIPISDDAYVEGDETFSVMLNSPVGSLVGSNPMAVVTIVDDDTAVPSINPLDSGAAFVRQHYLDFLSRTPDSSGLTYWTEQITDCGFDQACLKTKRVDVSNAFFYELEFQQTGAYVYRLYRAAFGNNQPSPNPNIDPGHPGEEKKLMSYQAFVLDRARVVGGSALAQSQLSLATAFVQRPEFVAKYAAGLSGPDFVDAILAGINSDSGVNLSSQRQALIDLYTQAGGGTAGRAVVLYRLADDNVSTNPINNRAFIDAEYNRAFVATQYFGYLRRNPDIGGFLFWLGQVNGAAIRDVAKQHAMVCSFITSTEYQQRFSSVVTHNNTECGF